MLQRDGDQDPDILAYEDIAHARQFGRLRTLLSVLDG